MQQRTLKLIVLQLRISASLLILALLAALLMSFTAKNVVADVWQQLGISKEKGLRNIESSFLNGYFQYYGAEKVKSILTGDRVAIAKDLMVYTKQQISSESFKKQYEKERQSAKPVHYPLEAKTKEAIRQEKISEAEKTIRETEANYKNMTPEIVKALQPTIELLKKNIKEYKDPNSKMIELLYQSEKINVENREKDYQEAVKNWETAYPADYRELVRRRLQKFVELAKTVDFSAELKIVNGKKKFVNPAYEYQTPEWKQIFRAGKDVIEPAVAFAGQWISELN